MSEKLMVVLRKINMFLKHAIIMSTSQRGVEMWIWVSGDNPQIFHMIFSSYFLYVFLWIDMACVVQHEHIKKYLKKNDEKWRVYHLRHNMTQCIQAWEWVINRQWFKNMFVCQGTSVSFFSRNSINKPRK